MKRMIPALLLFAQAAAAQSSLEVELVGAGTFSTGMSELPPTFAPDGQRALWTVSTPTYGRWLTILEVERRGDTWGQPRVAPFSGRWVDADPFFTPDGERLFFLSRRPLSGTRPERGYRVWYVDRSAGSWGTPVALPANVNNGDMHYAAPAASGALYIAGIREDSNGQGDIYHVPFMNGSWGDPVSVGPAINAPDVHDTTPYVAPDESWMIFSSTRQGGVGGLDLFISFPTGGQWSEPILLPEPINSRVRDFCPIASPDGEWLYFSSDRGFADQALDQPLDYAQLQQRMNSPGNSAGDIYRTRVADLLEWAREQSRRGSS